MDPGKRTERAVNEAAVNYDFEVKPTASLRVKNQLTIPREIADRVGAEPGDSFVVDVDPASPDVIRLRKLPRSYAGILPGVWGSHEDVLEYLREERASWGE